MQLEVSWPHSQAPAIRRYPEPDQSSPCLFLLQRLEVPFNIILPPTRRSSKWSLSIRSPTQNTVCTSQASHTCHMPRPSHYSWRSHPNNTGWAVQISKLLISSFLHSPVTSSLLGPNILFSALFSVKMEGKVDVIQGSVKNNYALYTHKWIIYRNVGRACISFVDMNPCPVLSIMVSKLFTLDDHL